MVLVRLPHDYVEIANSTHQPNQLESVYSPHGFANVVHKTEESFDFIPLLSELD